MRGGEARTEGGSEMDPPPPPPAEKIREQLAYKGMPVEGRESARQGGRLSSWLQSKCTRLNCRRGTPLHRRAGNVGKKKRGFGAPLPPPRVRANNKTNYKLIINRDLPLSILRQKDLELFDSTMENLLKLMRNSVEQVEISILHRFLCK